MSLTKKPGFLNNTNAGIEILETRFLKETGFLAGEEGPKTCRYFRFGESIVKKTGFLHRITRLLRTVSISITRQF